MSGIAEQYGFGDFHIIWTDPNNAVLAAKRDPHVLFPGDQVYIPDRTDKKEPRPTGAVHTFATDIPPLWLRVKLLDLDGKPMANIVCDVVVESAPPGPGQTAPPKPTTEQITTGKDGMLEKGPISRRAIDGEITAHIPPPPPPAPKKGAPAPNPDDPPPAPAPETKLNFPLKIGSLNPEFKMSGQQARLNNMGYYAGFSVTDLDQLLWAAEEFSCEKVSKPVTKRPTFQPAPPGGEDDETKSEPDKLTGIQEAALYNKIKQEHGI